MLRQLESLQAEAEENAKRTAGNLSLRNDLERATKQLDSQASTMLKIQSRRLDLIGQRLEGDPVLEEIEFSLFVARWALTQGRIRDQKERLAESMQRLPAVSEQTNVQESFERLAEAARAEKDKVLKHYSALGTQRLELSLVSCFGFWATIGILIGWVEKRERSPDGAVGAEP